MGILSFIFTYIFLLLLWLVINLVLYAVSLLSRKNLLTALLGLNWIISLGLQLYLFGYALYALWLIVSNGEWLLLILALIFGSFLFGFWQMVYNFLLFPFSTMALFFFSQTASFIERPEEKSEVDYISPEGEITGGYESEDIRIKKLAKWFLAFYGLNLASLMLFPVEREGLLLCDYLLKPFMQVIGGTLLVGIPYSIYHKIRYKTFLPEDRAYFFIEVWKLDVYIFGFFGILIFILALITGTL